MDILVQWYSKLLALLQQEDFSTEEAEHLVSQKPDDVGFSITTDLIVEWHWIIYEASHAAENGEKYARKLQAHTGQLVADINRRGAVVTTEDLLRSWFAFMHPDNGKIFVNILPERTLIVSGCGAVSTGRAPKPQKLWGEIPNLHFH